MEEGGMEEGEGENLYNPPPTGELNPIQHVSDMATYQGTGPPGGGDDGGDDSDMSGGEDDDDVDESDEGSDTESNVMVVLEPDHVSLC